MFAPSPASPPSVSLSPDGQARFSLGWYLPPGPPHLAYLPHAADFPLLSLSPCPQPYVQPCLPSLPSALHVRLPPSPFLDWVGFLVMMGLFRSAQTQTHPLPHLMDRPKASQKGHWAV